MYRWLKRLFTPQKRPLASAQPAQSVHKVPLGMEATDLSLLARITRRNQALDRVPAARLMPQAAGALDAAETDPLIRFDDDETYAGRYHAAFQTKDKTP